MGRKFEQNRFNIPPTETLNGLDETVPSCLAGDKMFPLKEWLMHPFVGKQLTDEMRKVFNYRLSRAQRIVENTFGILVSRLRMLQKPIEGEPELVEKTVLAATALHNYLQQADKVHYTPAGFVDSKDKSAAIYRANGGSLLIVIFNV